MEPVSRFDGGFILYYDTTGEPVANMRYRIRTASGQSYEGTTNHIGRTQVVDTDQEEELEIELLGYADDEEGEEILSDDDNAE